MDEVGNLLFQAYILKKIPRSGYHFLGAGEESVAEHVFLTSFIAYVMGRMHPDADAFRLVRMCLVHDLLESRTGDLNLVQKQYVISDEKKAKEAMVKNIPFGQEMAELLAEFEKGETLEARLARDADQLSFILDLKSLSDMGHLPARKWLNFVIQRLVTPTGKKIAETILATEQDAWWLKLFNPIDA